MFTKLYDNWTETKKAIDYNSFQKLFEIRGQGDEKGDKKGATVKGKGAKGAAAKGKGTSEKGATEKGRVAQKEDRGEAKKSGNKEKPNKWVGGVLTGLKQGKPTVPVHGVPPKVPVHRVPIHRKR